MGDAGGTRRWCRRRVARAPIFADIEAGRASVADRKVPYAEIHNSKEMLEFIVFLEQEAKRHPNRADRPFETVIVDTIDGYSRKVQQEWLQQTGKPTFTGYEAWGYLDQKMQQLLVRLLNLDYNLIAVLLGGVRGSRELFSSPFTQFLQ